MLGARLGVREGFTEGFELGFLLGAREGLPSSGPVGGDVVGKGVGTGVDEVGAGVVGDGVGPLAFGELEGDSDMYGIYDLQKSHARGHPFLIVPIPLMVLVQYFSRLVAVELAF